MHDSLFLAVGFALPKMDEYTEKVAARKYGTISVSSIIQRDVRLPNIRLDNVVASWRILLTFPLEPVLPSPASRHPLPVAGNELFIANRIF